MKTFLLKLFNFIINIIMVVSCAYAVFNTVMTFLPAETQAVVYDYLNMSQEYIATFSISSTINAVVIIASKIAQTQTRIALTEKLTQAEATITQDVSLNEAVAERENQIIANLETTETLLNALLEVQKVTTNRNIKASDTLVYTEEKEAYKKALDEIIEAQNLLLGTTAIETTTSTEATETATEQTETTSTNELAGRV